MKRFLSWVLFLLPVIEVAAAPLKIADSTCDGCATLKIAAIAVADQLPEGVELHRLSAAAALEKLRSGEVDMVLAELPDEAARAGLSVKKFGCEAVAVYVNILNSVNNVSLEKLREIYAANRPEWSKIGGASRDIHRFYLTPGRPGSGLVESFLGKPPVGGALSLNSSAEGILLAQGDPEAMTICRWQAEYPIDQVKTLAVEVVPPTTENIRKGEYPLTRQYVWLYRSVSPALEAFWAGLATPAVQEVFTSEGWIAPAEKD